MYYQLHHFFLLSMFLLFSVVALCFVLLYWGMGVHWPLGCKTNEFHAIKPSQVVVLRHALMIIKHSGMLFGLKSYTRDLEIEGARCEMGSK